MKKALQLLVQVVVIMALVWAVLALTDALGNAVHALLPW